MLRTIRRRVGPWVIPAVVVIEVALVWSGVLSLVDAIVIVLVIEALLILTAAGRGVASVRRFRAERSAGRDGWTAALDAMSEMVPRPVARVLLIEARMWVCVVLAVARRRPPPGSFSYGRGLRPMLVVALALVAAETVVTELVLYAILGPSAWVWVLLALHLYGLVWLGGFLASLSVVPHRVTGTQVVLRDSVMGVVTVPREAIVSVREEHRSYVGRSGLKIDDDGSLLLTYGDAAVRLELDPDVPLDRDGEPFGHRVAVVRLGVDEPAAFVAAVRSLTASGGSADPGRRGRAAGG